MEKLRSEKAQLQNELARQAESFKAQVGLFSPLRQGFSFVHHFGYPFVLRPYY